MRTPGFTSIVSLAWIAALATGFNSAQQKPAADTTAAQPAAPAAPVNVS